MRMFRMVPSLLAIFLFLATSHARAAEVPAQQAPRGILLFVLTTGLEDSQTISSVFRHAAMAAEQHRLQEVAVLVYGRGVQALDELLKARPPQTAQFLKMAHAAGVRIRVCAHALEQMGIDRKNIDAQVAEVVPSAMALLVDYVARGATVVRY